MCESLAAPSCLYQKDRHQDLFFLAARDNYEAVNDLLKAGAYPNDRDSYGRTALHICCTHGCTETAAVLLRWSADTGLQDYENGWTPLHRSLYFGHLKCTLLLLKVGAVLGDEFSKDDSSVEIEFRGGERSIRNCESWKSPFDHDGHSPLDLLSLKLSSFLPVSVSPKPDYFSSCTEVLVFGKADFFLGIPLPRAATDVSRPRPVADLTLDVPMIDVAAGKYHSAALSAGGQVFSWGIGKGGRLGHGDEATQVQPKPISSFPGNPRIVQIAVAENHMLALDSFGGLYSWGSNRFGQLGRGGSASEHNFSPQRVDKLHRQCVRGIAAGDRHSICFTEEGEVWTWGCNKDGQLGYRLTSTENGCGAPGSSSPGRVSGLMTGGGGRSRGAAERCRVLQVCASRGSSLVLLASDDRASRPQNEVYQWGHGSYSPYRVQFQHPAVLHSNRINDNISMLSAGENHFVGISASSGFVYTWGLGAAQLGHGIREKPHVSSPQIVSQMLPENGGGKAVYVSAAGDRTCVVTDRGDLFTWGCSRDEGVLGAGAGKYQPVPKRVVGVKRAVRVAASADHTIVLVAASVPPLPFSDAPATSVPSSTPQSPTEDREELEFGRSQWFVDEEGGGNQKDEEQNETEEKEENEAFPLLTLKEVAERQVAVCVNLRNVLQTLSFAEFYDARGLTKFCVSFILRNLDAILIQQLNISGGRSRSNPYAELEVLVSDITAAMESMSVETPSTTQVADSEATEANSSYKNVINSIMPGTRSLQLREICKDLYTLPDSVDGAQRKIKSVRKKLSKARSKSGDEGSLQELESFLQRLLQFVAEKKSEDATLTAAGELSKDKEKSNREGPAETTNGIVSQTRARADSATVVGAKNAPAPPTAPTQKRAKKHGKTKYIPISTFEARAVQTSVSDKADRKSSPPTSSPWGKVPPRSDPPDSLASYMAMTAAPSAPVTPVRVLATTVAAGINQFPQQKMNSTPPVVSNIARSPLSGTITLDAYITAGKKQRKSNKKGKSGLTPDGDITGKDRSSSCPWSSPPSSSSGLETAQRRLSDIQREEELERSESNLKQLAGNSSPWLSDRRNARAFSLENVMQVQQQEKERARLQEEEERDVQAAIAAVERMTKMEENRKKVPSTKKRNGRKKHNTS